MHPLFEGFVPIQNVYTWTVDGVETNIIVRMSLAKPKRAIFVCGTIHNVCDIVFIGKRDGQSHPCPDQDPRVKPGRWAGYVYRRTAIHPNKDGHYFTCRFVCKLNRKAHASAHTSTRPFRTFEGQPLALEKRE